MSGLNEARELTISGLGKAFTEAKIYVDGLVRTTKPNDTMRLVQQKLDKLELYINTLKTLIPQAKGGYKTRKNRRN